MPRVILRLEIVDGQPECTAFALQSTESSGPIRAVDIGGVSAGEVINDAIVWVGASADSIRPDPGRQSRPRTGSSTISETTY